MKQASLIALPRRPSVTAAATRVRRDKARAWAKAQGLKTWEPDTRSCIDLDPRAPRALQRRHECGGAFLPHPVFGGEARPVCWNCIPYPGAPVRNFEHWSVPGGPDVCIRCNRSMENRGGMYGREGPYCWECGAPDKASVDAWLLRLRDNPDESPPWKGDKVKRHV